MSRTDRTLNGNRSVNESLDRSMNKSSDRSMNESSDRSTNESSTCKDFVAVSKSKLEHLCVVVKS